MSEQGRADWPEELHLYLNPDGTQAGYATDAGIFALERPADEGGPYEIGVYVPKARLTQLVEGLEAEVERLADEYDASYGLFAKTDAPSTAAAADATAQYALTITRRLQALIDNYKAKEPDHG